MRRYRGGELEEKLERNGFVIEFSSSFVSVPLPLMIASRTVSRVRGKNAEPGREVAIAPLTNCVLASILRAEVNLTLAGWRWRMGGSRVVVARSQQGSGHKTTRRIMKWF